MGDAHSPRLRLPNAGYRKLLAEMELTKGYVDRNQVQIPNSGSPLPLWERARVRERRAQVRLIRARIYPCHPFMEEG